MTASAGNVNPDTTAGKIYAWVYWGGIALTLLGATTALTAAAIAALTA